MPKQSWFNVQASASDTTAGDVAIRGPIGEWGVNDREFIASVEALGEVDTLNVRVNSRGGELDHALSIFNYLRSHKAKVNVRVDGVALSSGSVIAMAGDRIEMAANAVMMVHNPWSFAMGNAKQLRKKADDLDAFEASLRVTYMARTGKTEDEIRAMLEDETYMTAAEAVEMGFADEVIPIAKSSAESSALAFASALGIPADVLARIEAAEAADDAGQGDEAGGNDDAAGDDPAPDETEQSAAPAAGMAPALAESIDQACASAGLSAYAADIALDASIQDLAGADHAIRAAREIVALCAVAGQQDMASGLIRARKTLNEARADILTARAAADEATHTSSHFPQPNAQTRQTAADVWAKVLPTRH